MGLLTDLLGDGNGTSDPLWVPASRFQANFGSPTLNATAGAPGWLLDAAATEVVVALEDIPSNWPTVDIDLWWTNISGGGAGNVVWNFRYAWMRDGDDLTAGETNLGNLTAAAPAAFVTEVTAMASAVVPVAGERMRFSIRRVGGDAADTLANDCSMLGMAVRPTP